ncbi:Mor transcription activator family protein [Serratia oryzae]|uniref:Mor transcription activator family protein n=1 Tax=Serratia oryzae TaxID=2034155 RepID=UPI0012E2DA07|nr:Mor transcription activator family protein [Serratia oryzae]
MKNPQDYLPHLTENMRQMVGVIGIDNTLSIMKLYGGQSIEMVSGVKDSVIKRQITQAIGESAADLLIRYFSRETIYIQMVSSVESKILRSKRNQEIGIRFSELIKDNQNYNNAVRVLSGEFALSDRQIYKIITRI